MRENYQVGYEGKLSSRVIRDNYQVIVIREKYQGRLKGKISCNETIA